MYHPTQACLVREAAAGETTQPLRPKRVRGRRRNKIVSRCDTVVPALLVHGRLHPKQDKTRETKRSL